MRSCMAWHATDTMTQMKEGHVDQCCKTFFGRNKVYVTDRQLWQIFSISFHLQIG